MSLDFNALGLPPKMLQALARMNFTKPTPIQEQAIPLALKHLPETIAPMSSRQSLFRNTAQVAVRNL